MPSIVLKLKGSAPENRSTQPPDNAGPLFRGSGDTDYLCGNCGFVIASGMGPTQHVSVDRTICAACGTENEFPPNLRS